MLKPTRLLCLAVVILGALAPAVLTPPGHAYVEAPMSLGSVIAQSSHVVLMRVESVDREKNLIIYRKVRDLKNKHPQEVIKHNIGRGGLRPNEWKPPMDWAEPGKLAVFFHNGGASETCIGTWWYQSSAGGEWWNHVHGEPFLLRSFAGNPEKLAAIVTAIVAGKEVIVPCMVDGNKDDLHSRRAKIQRVKASLKLLDYNPKRDFVGWGGEDFRRLNGMPGFTHYSALSRVDPEAQGISAVDFNDDGKADLCLLGGARVAVLANGGESLNEITIPGASGGRAVVWADYNGDGKPDLLLATSGGPKLFTNLGGGAFRDDSHLLPQEPYYSVTTAAWIDADGDGKPDILFSNGYHGLRLYRNVGDQKPPAVPKVTLGKWHYLGPFDNTGGRGFTTVHPVEKAVDLRQQYQGKNGEPAVWKQRDFADGQVNNLTLFRPQNNVWSAVYLYREIESDSAVDLPASFGSDDTLTVWFNGKRIVARNEYRSIAPDQDRAVLKLNKGKNHLLLKICNGDGDWAFYFQAGKLEAAVPQGKHFADVSAQFGLGPEGIGAGVKGDTLTVCDVNGDGRADVLYGAGTGMLLLNTGTRFVRSRDSGIAYRPGKVGPVFGDFDGDGHPDLFVPQAGQCKLFKNDGKGRFTDVTAQAGALANLHVHATSAAWGDVDNDGHLDLVIGCLRGPNRYLRNKGDGTFEDLTEAVGLDQRIFNTQGVCLVDLNNDGVLDMVFNNEGQDSCVLLGSPPASKRTPVTLAVAGRGGVIGSRVQVTDKQGKSFGVQEISGGDGRGGQRLAQARFALPPGAYRVVVRYSSGLTRARDLTVTARPVRGRIDEQTPEVK